MPGPDLTRLDRRIRVAVVEEHELLRCGLAACLAEDQGVDVRVAEADEARQHDMDLAVVSSEAAGRHRFPCPIVVCSDDPGGPRNVAAGNDVAGILHRGSVTAAQLHATVQAAAAGLQVQPQGNGNHDHEGLDPRAVRLLQLVDDGHSTREIAARMSYSERTIKKLVAGLEHRMQARSRAQLVAHAIRRGLI